MENRQERKSRSPITPFFIVGICFLPYVDSWWNMRWVFIVFPIIILFFTTIYYNYKWAEIKEKNPFYILIDNLIIGIFFLLVLPPVTSIFNSFFIDLGGTLPTATQLTLDVFFPLNGNYGFIVLVLVGYILVISSLYFTISAIKVKYWIQWAIQAIVLFYISWSLYTLYFPTLYNMG